MKGTIVRKRKEHTEFQMKRNKKTWLAVAGAITAGLCILVLTSKGFKSMERSTLLPVKKQAEKVTEMIGSIAQAALQTQKNIAVKEAFPALNEEYELVYANIPIFNLVQPALISRIRTSMRIYTTKRFGRMAKKEWNLVCGLTEEKSGIR